MKKLIMSVIATGAFAAMAGLTVSTNGTAVTVNNTGSSATLTQAFLNPDVSTVTYSLDYPVYYNPSEASTYTGGTVVTKGQLYPKRGDAFGTGAVTLGGDGSILVDGGNLTIPNKIVFGQSNNSYVTTLGLTYALTLNSIGTPSDSATHHMRLGRTGAGDASKATLSLTAPGSEAISQIRLSGALALTLDGGTVKTRSDALNPFFSVATPGDAADITVATGGITFYTQEGSDLILGAQLKFTAENEIAVIDTYYPENYSFENGSGSAYTSWVDSPHPNVYNEYSSICANGSPFDTNGSDVWTTTNGNRYGMIRRKTSISQTINIPADGFWRVVYEQGCRPGSSGYSLGLTMTVSVDGDSKLVVPAVTTVADMYPFTEKKTDLFELTAGEHTLAFTVGDSSTASRSLNIDAVRLERVSIAERIGSLTKTGVGNFILSDQPLNGVTVNANSGKLLFVSETITNTTLNVANGGVAELYSPVFGEDTVVNVAAGGTLAIVEADGNLIANGNFEADGVIDFTGMAMKGWVCERLEPFTTKNSGGFGLQCNGGTVAPSGPATPYNVETAFLRECNRISQTFTVTESNTYVISFVQSCRKYLSGYRMQTTVTVDGVEALTTPVQSAYYDYTRFTAEITLAAGEHTITFTTGATETSGSGEMVFIDDVSVRLKSAEAVQSEGEIRMASGSTLQLDNSDPVNIKYFYVGGVKINGRRSAIADAGVTVTGSGMITVGVPRGFTLSIR